MTPHPKLPKDYTINLLRIKNVRFDALVKKLNDVGLVQIRSDTTEPDRKRALHNITEHNITDITEHNSLVIYDDILTIWNDLSEVTPVPKVKKLTAERRKKLAAIIKLYPEIETWKEIIATIKKTPFLLGENDRGWVVDFDFVIRSDTNFTKILEGKYTKHKKKESDRPPPEYGC